MIPQCDVIKMAYVDQMIDKRDKERERIENCIHTRSWLRNLLKFDSWSKWRSSLMRKGQLTFIGVGAGTLLQITGGLQYNYIKNFVTVYTAFNPCIRGNLLMRLPKKSSYSTKNCNFNSRLPLFQGSNTLKKYFIINSTGKSSIRL